MTSPKGEGAPWSLASTRIRPSFSFATPSNGIATKSFEEMNHYAGKNSKPLSAVIPASNPVSINSDNDFFSGQAPSPTSTLVVLGINDKGELTSAGVVAAPGIQASAGDTVKVTDGTNQRTITITAVDGFKDYSGEKGMVDFSAPGEIRIYVDSNIARNQSELAGVVRHELAELVVHHKMARTKGFNGISDYANTFLRNDTNRRKVIATIIGMHNRR